MAWHVVWVDEQPVFDSPILDWRDSPKCSMTAAIDNRGIGIYPDQVSVGNLTLSKIVSEKFSMEKTALQ